MSFKLPAGVFPTMITPFNADGSIDYKCVDALVEWYIASGVVGIFTVCQSSEMYHLSPAERLELARRVVKKVDKRVSVVGSGTFGGPVAQQAEFVREMGGIVDAVVILTNQFGPAEDNDDVWTTRIQELLELTPGIPLGFYECPVPYKRILPPKVLTWAATTGRFLFHKDTCCSSEGIASKLTAIGALPTTNFSFYNANVATLLFSLEKHGSGFSGISANFYPQLLAWLCNNYNNNNKIKAAEVQDALSVFENVVMYKYPTSAKIYLSLFPEFPITSVCRTVQNVFDEEEIIKLNCLHRQVQKLCDELGVKLLSPAQFY